MTPAASALDTAAATALSARERTGLRRHRTTWHPTGAVTAERDGRTFINFASNNYLGFTHHPRLLGVLRGASAVGSGAAGLVSGYTPAHARAEAAIAKWKSCEAAVLLPSGYQANLAMIQSLAAIAAVFGGVRFLVDKLAHASLIDAVRCSGQAFRIFPHNGLSKLERLLESAPRDAMQVVVTESIFSMDGDAAALSQLAALKARYGFVLVVDEAHGSGVYGRDGAGLIDEAGVREAVDVTVVTLSKALGLSGAAVCGSARFVQAVENFGRAYIYSTSVPPLTAELATTAVALCREEPQHQQRVRGLAKAVRARLEHAGYCLPAGDSPIIPILLGDPAAALAAAERLAEAGLLAIAVRPPTVPPGTSRLRVTLSAAHTDEQIDRLVDALLTLPRAADNTIECPTDFVANVTSPD